MQVVLRTDDGNDLNPKSFIGPDAPNVFDPEHEYNTARIDGQQFILNKRTWFRLYFDRTPYPNMNFLLFMKGIEKSSKPYPIPEIHFQQDSAWEYGVIP